MRAVAVAPGPLRFERPMMYRCPVTDEDASVGQLKSLVADFCTARDWDRYHGAKDLAVGIVTEAAELLDLFRFKSDVEVESMLAGAPARAKAEHELADVLFFVLRFAQRYGIDLSGAFERKLALNAERYPIEKAKGSNLKYTEL
jgi:NTP pyrophosphatase (non-canonical NTP hydrolase)